MKYIRIKRLLVQIIEASEYTSICLNRIPRFKIFVRKIIEVDLIVKKLKTEQKNMN